jgi:phosphoglucosamine mutase
MSAVDETGRFVPGDELLALFALETSPGDAVAAPVNASALIDTVVADSGGSVVRTAVGDGNVAAACAESGAGFGGEPSGAWIWPDETLVPDGHYAACRLAEIVATGDPLSVRLDAFPRFVTKRESFRCDDADVAVSHVAAQVSDRYDTVTELDGVRVDVDDGWFLVRASGTEPLLRVTAEADTEGRAADLLSDATALARDAIRATRD